MMETAVPDITQMVDWIAASLVQGSVQGALLVVLVWMVCRSAYVTPRVRAMLWWIVSLKLVLTFVPLPSVPLPVLPASPSIDAVATTSDDVVGLEELSVFSGADLSSPHDATESHLSSVRPQTSASPVPWLAIIVMSWCVVIAVHVIRLVATHRRVVGIVRRAIPVTAQESLEVEYLAQRVGLRRTPVVCASDEVASPQAIGIRRPTIVLPKGFLERMAPAEWQMALCHELWHLRRRDLLLGWVPAIAARLFFFHPFALAAANQYLLAREAACDAAAVEALDVDAHDYARMLVRLGLSRTPDSLAASGAAPTASLLRRRLEMLQQVTTTAGASRAHWFVVVAALTLIPFHLVAQSPAPSVDSAIVANVAVVQPIGAAPALPSIELNRRPERKAAQAQAPRPAVPAALPQKSAAPKPSAVEEQNATSASANEQFAKDLAEELNKNAAAISAQAQEAVHQLLAQRDELARRYSPMHPDLRALDLQLAELRQLSSNEALKGLSAGMAGLSGLQEQLRFAAQALQNAPGGQDPAAAAAREAQIKALSQQIEALSKQLAAMQPNAGDQKDVQQKVQLKALAAQLKALEAVQREVERDRLRQSTRQFLDAEVAQRRANVEALTAARQSAVNEQDRQRLDVQLQAARAELQALEAKTRDAARAAQVTRQAEVRQRATNQQLDSRQLEAAIARERANVERQKQLLNSAQQRLSQAEARLREREQRLKQQNSQTPQAPQAPQPPQKSQTPQNPRP